MRKLQTRLNDLLGGMFNRNGYTQKASKAELDFERFSTQFKQYQNTISTSYLWYGLELGDLPF